jgi:hypothetical protein
MNRTLKPGDSYYIVYYPANDQYFFVLDKDVALRYSKELREDDASGVVEADVYEIKIFKQIV